MVNSIRNITFWILAILSGFLSVNMFFQLGTTPLEKAVFVLVTVALEGLKIFTIINANINWDSGKRLRGATRYFAYVFIAIISVVASLGYTLTTINRINAAAKVSSNAALIQSYDDQVVYYKGLKKANEDTITANTKALRTLGDEYNKTLPTLIEQKDKDKLTAAYFATKKKIEDANATLQAKNDDYFTKQLDNETKSRDARLKDTESATYQKTSDSMFKLIGDRIGMTEQATMFLILIVISINIEVGIVFTAPHPTLDKKKKKRKNNKKNITTKVEEDEEDDDDEDEDEEDYDPQSQHNPKDLTKKEDEALAKKLDIPLSTLKSMDLAVENMKKGIVSDPINLDEPKIEILKPIAPIQRIPEHIEPSSPWPRPAPKPVETKPVQAAPLPPISTLQPKPQSTPAPIEKKEDEAAFLKKVEPTLKKILNEEDKEKLIVNIEKVVDEIRAQGGKKFSIENLSMKTGISLDEIKKMFQYMSNLNLLSFDDATKTWKFRINRDEILNYLRNMPTIKY